LGDQHGGQSLLDLALIKACSDFGQRKLERLVDWQLAGLEGAILKTQGFASNGGSSLSAHG
jgi:hypothetical protein